MSDISLKPKSANRRPKNIFRFFAAALGIPLVLILILFIFSSIDKTDPRLFVPAGFDLYASTGSASEFTARVLNLKVLDAALSGAGTRELRATVRELRSNPFLQSGQFKKLADVQVEAAYYPGGEFVAVADFGWRSALTRWAPFFGKRLASGILPVKGLSWNEYSSPKRFEYGNGTDIIYIAVIKNLLVASSSESLFTDAMKGSSSSEEAQKLLAIKTQGNLRILVNTASLIAETAAGAGLGASIVRTIGFPELSVADLELSDSDIRLTLRAKANSTDPAIATLLSKRSRTPAALSSMPESVEYFSLLAAGSPEYLWTNFSPRLGEKAIAAKESADKAAKILLGKTCDEIIFSWIGDELGIFGTTFGPAPVFFAKVSDEKTRRLIFDEVLASPVIGRDISATVDGVRVPRIVFPDFLDSFLQTLGIDLPEPFYMVEDGFFFASSSAETLAACVEQIRSGKLLSKTSQWDSSAGRISMESSMMLYYNLERSLPFFLRSAAGPVNALKLYNRGAFSISFRSGELRIEIAAVKENSIVTEEIPGFPASAGSRMLDDPICASDKKGFPMAYWPGKKTVEAMNLSSGERFSMEMDESGQIALDTTKGTIESVWAVSSRGTVYCLDAQLNAKDGFPLVTGQSPSGPSTISEGRLLIPVSEGPSIMIVAPDAVKTFSASLHAKLRSKPLARGSFFAALPRSFDSLLYVFNASGTLAGGWPVHIESLASAAPVFAPGTDAQSFLVGALTEAGSLSLFRDDGIPQEGFPVSLSGTFDGGPIWVESLFSFLAISTDGLLWRIAKNGGSEGTFQVPHIRGRNAKLISYDANGDGHEEIFIGNDGNILMGLAQDFSVIQGFPVAGSGAPSFIDIDGDGKSEMLCRSTDDMIHAYKVGW